MRKLFLSTLFIFIFYSCINKESNSQTYTNESEDAVETSLIISVKRGKQIYQANCVSCHLASGKGVAGAFPPLNPSNWLTEKRKESIHAVKYGLKGPIQVNGKPYNQIMLPLGLDDKQVADVLNYAIQTWASGDEVTVKEVEAVGK